MENNSVPLLFTENIHDTEDFRIYVAEKKGDTAYSGVSLRLGFESDIANLRYISEVNPGAMSPINPTFSPIIKVSAMFDTIIQEISVFDSELRRLIREDQTLFILLSIEILAFFIFSGTLIRLSKFPLFLVVVMIITLRFFFFIFAGFVDGRPALLLDILLPWDIYKPLIGIGYFSLILFFISIRYSLVHPRNRRELPT